MSVGKDRESRFRKRAWQADKGVRSQRPMHYACMAEDGLHPFEYPSAFYHATSRGNEQQDIFKDQKDRERVLPYLESAAVRYGAIGHTWCLVSNHYHLLLETPSGNLSQIRRHINGAYTTYFNAKRKRQAICSREDTRQ